MASGKRNDLIDALKFFAIALVPLQHLLNLRTEFNHLFGAQAALVFMVGFDMPLFVFLSGYVLFGREGANPARLVWRKALILLTPYFAWVTVEMAIEHVPLVQWPGKLAVAAIQPHQAYQMWFLWVLFVLFVIFTLVRLASRADLTLAAVGLVAGAARILPRTTAFGIDKIALLLPFLALGYLCAKHREKVRRFDLLIAVVGVPAFAVMSVFPQPTIPGQFALAVLGIVTAWAIYRLLPHWAIAPQAWVGRRSLGIYAGQMVTLPLVLVGTGWLGVALSEATTMLASIALATALEVTAVTRAVFLGQWPRPAVPRSRPVATVAVHEPQPRVAPSAAESEPE
jgi:fucose 4-O-acetylase-like acetyltransferase